MQLSIIKVNGNYNVVVDDNFFLFIEVCKIAEWDWKEQIARKISEQCNNKIMSFGFIYDSKLPMEKKEQLLSKLRKEIGNQELSLSKNERHIQHS